MTDFRMNHVRVYSVPGSKAHLVAIADSPGGGSSAVCGAYPGGEGFWYGTLGADEYGIAQALPLCKGCREATA